MIMFIIKHANLESSMLLLVLEVTKNVFLQHKGQLLLLPSAKIHYITFLKLAHSMFISLFDHFLLLRLTPKLQVSKY